MQHTNQSVNTSTHIFSYETLRKFILFLDHLQPWCFSSVFLSLWGKILDYWFISHTETLTATIWHCLKWFLTPAALTGYDFRGHPVNYRVYLSQPLSCESPWPTRHLLPLRQRNRMLNTTPHRTGSRWSIKSSCAHNTWARDVGTLAPTLFIGVKEEAAISCQEQDVNEPEEQPVNKTAGMGL